MKRILALAVTDIKNISRDSTLLLMAFGVIALFSILTFGIPPLTVVLMRQLDFDLTAYYRLILSFFGLIPSMLFGMLIGFLMLDERDEEIITYISVTPLGRMGYLSYKLLAAAVVSFFFYFITVYGSGLAPLPLARTSLLALTAALEAPMAALFLVAFADDKVEGMALGKVFGMIYLGPFAAFFVTSDLQWIAGVLPPFWITKAYTAAEPAAFYLYIACGLAVHLAVIFLLLKKFLSNRR